MEEYDKPIPADFISDGLLHYLCVLTVLLHPSPPPLIIMDEPEIGLHPDILYRLYDILAEASQKCQIIVTTHSASLVSSFTDSPDDVMVAERSMLGTQITRLNGREIKPLLEDHGLEFLWSRGDLGGTVW
jgi:predicted ATPase